MTNKLLNNKIITWITICWCLLIGSLWYWNWVQTEQAIIQIARAEAYASAEKDIMYHKWAGLQGGLYVRPTEKTPPNPYLSFLPEQTLLSRKGETFTLINPAYMVRQVNELYQQQTGRTARLTSLHPIRPENAPDPWERQALKSFSQNPSQSEAYTQETINSHEYIRILRPMYAVKSCLKCHRKSGYDLRVNDLRGGISVTVDLTPYKQAIYLQRLKISGAYFLVWFVGLFGLWLWERKNSEFINKLQTKNQQLQTLLDAAPDLICMKDGEGRWLEANKVALEIFSIQDIEFKGKTNIELADFAAKRFRESFQSCTDTDNQAWQCQHNVRLEELITTANNGERFFDIIKAPIFHDDGSRQGMIVLGRDITDLKKNEAEIQLLMSAIDQTAEAIIITDRQGVIQYANPATEQNSGYRRAELIGQKPSIFNSGHQNQAYYTTLWETITAGKVWSGRIVNRHKTGGLFTEEMTISPVRNNKGEIVNFVAVKQDITRQIAVEKEKEHMEQQFRQAQKMESVGRVAGGIAHDLNNLLTPMLGYSEFLLRPQAGLESQHTEKIEKILLAGHKARDIVQRLLSFSRKQPLDIHTLQVNTILCDFKQLLRGTLREDIGIEMLLAPESPSILADTGRLEQIIMNIAVNAQDAMNDGGSLVIETRIIDMDTTTEHQEISCNCSGEYVVIAFSDTGTGMKPEVLNTIFEPFFTTKDKLKGTGLGLSTVYGIVKQLHGEISVQSAAGEGSCFCLYFPLVESLPQETGTLEQHDSLHTRQTKSVNILVVEDDTQVRDLIVMVLKRGGLQVMEAENGYDALTQFQQESITIDLLLTDIVMPKMNGKELYEQLLISDPELRVIFLSGYTEDVLVEEDLLNNNVRFLQKPFAIAELSAMVDQALS